MLYGCSCSVSLQRFCITALRLLADALFGAAPLCSPEVCMMWAYERYVVPVKYDAKTAYGLHFFFTSGLDRGQW
jgi:hypothetical protein